MASIVPLVDDIEDVDLPPIRFNAVSDEIEYPTPLRVLSLERLRRSMRTPTPAILEEITSAENSFDSATRSSDNNRTEDSGVEGVPRRRGPTFPKRTP